MKDSSSVLESKGKRPWKVPNQDAHNMRIEIDSEPLQAIDVASHSGGDSASPVVANFFLDEASDSEGDPVVGSASDVVSNGMNESKTCKLSSCDASEKSPSKCLSTTNERLTEPQSAMESLNRTCCRNRSSSSLSSSQKDLRLSTMRFYPSEKLNKLFILNGNSSPSTLTIRLCNWMHHPSIRCMRFWDVTLPGSHNSASWSLAPNKKSRFSGLISIFLKLYIHCQDKPILQQLSMGVRFLDIRICKASSRGGEIYCAHGGFRTVPLKEVLRQIVRFCSRYGSEIIVLSVRRDVAFVHGPASVSIGESDALVALLLSRFLGPELSEDITVNELVARHQNILYFFEDRERYFVGHSDRCSTLDGNFFLWPGQSRGVEKRSPKVCPVSVVHPSDSVGPISRDSSVSLSNPLQTTGQENSWGVKRQSSNSNAFFFSRLNESKERLEYLFEWSEPTLVMTHGEEDQEVDEMIDSCPRSLSLSDLDRSAPCPDSKPRYRRRGHYGRLRRGRCWIGTDSQSHKCGSGWNASPPSFVGVPKEKCDEMSRPRNGFLQVYPDRVDPEGVGDVVNKSPQYFSADQVQNNLQNHFFSGNSQSTTFDKMKNVSLAKRSSSHFVRRFSYVVPSSSMSWLSTSTQISSNSPALYLAGSEDLAQDSQHSTQLVTSPPPLSSFKKESVLEPSVDDVGLDQKPGGDRETNHLEACNDAVSCKADHIKPPHIISPVRCRLAFQSNAQSSLFVSGHSRIIKSWSLTCDTSPQGLCEKLVRWSALYGSACPRNPFVLRILAGEVTPPSFGSPEASMDVIRFWTIQGAASLCFRNGGLKSAAVETHKVLRSEVLKPSVIHRVNGITHDFIDKAIISTIVKQNISKFSPHDATESSQMQV